MRKATLYGDMLRGKLYESKCATAKPKAKQYKLSDGKGLYLLVKPNGSRLWQMKYNYLGKEKTLSLGQYPVVSLEEARAGWLVAKRILMAGYNPSPPSDVPRPVRLRALGIRTT